MRTRRDFLRLAAALAVPACSDPPRPQDRKSSTPTRVSSAPVAAVPTAEGVASPERLRKVHAALAPLQPFRPRPKAGEWLADHPEPGQSFARYLESRPHTPTPSRRTLVVAPLGTLPRASLDVVDLAREYLAAHFGLPTRLAAPIDPGRPPRDSHRVHDGEEQLLTTWLLHDVLPSHLEADAAALIAFTGVDLYPDPKWNYVFGEASDRDPVGVWSLHRYGDPAASKSAFHLAMVRALKLAVHETGHIFSLPHCTAYPCVQSGVNSLEETDTSPLWLCTDCLCKIAFATGNDPRALLTSTREFAKAHGLEAEAAFFDRALEATKDV